MYLVHLGVLYGVGVELRLSGDGDSNVNNEILEETAL